MEDLRTLNKLKSPKRPVSPSTPEHVPSAPMENPSQRYEARIEEGKLYYDKRWYHKSQAIYLESKDNTKISCVISSVGTNEIWVRKTSDSTKMRIYLGQLQRGAFVIRRRSAAWNTSAPSPHLVIYPSIHPLACSSTVSLCGASQLSLTCALLLIIWTTPHYSSKHTHSVFPGLDCLIRFDLFFWH